MKKLYTLLLAGALVCALAGEAAAARLLTKTITTAQAGQVTTAQQLQGGAPPQNIVIQATFTYGSGGTSTDAYVQTSVDNGATWCDVAEFSFTTATGRKIFNLTSNTPVTTQATPTDGSLAANTAVNGILGPLWRVKYTTVGTYGGSTTLNIDVFTSRLGP